ncbi:hypothetical protein KC19_N028100 [Ceratodon purpureus]|nr:hypothetical protein KC19_N028100 [Ceratodon purpureus]
MLTRNPIVMLNWQPDSPENKRTIALRQTATTVLRLSLYLSEVPYISALQEGKYTPAPTWKQVGSRDTQSRESRWHFVVVSKRPSPLPPPNQGNTIATFLELHSRNQLNDLLGPRHGRYAGGSATPS